MELWGRAIEALSRCDSTFIALREHLYRVAIEPLRHCERASIAKRRGENHVSNPVFRRWERHFAPFPPLFRRKGRKAKCTIHSETWTHEKSRPSIKVGWGSLGYPKLTIVSQSKDGTCFEPYFPFSRRKEQRRVGLGKATNTIFGVDYGIGKKERAWVRFPVSSLFRRGNSVTFARKGHSKRPAPTTE